MSTRPLRLTVLALGSRGDVQPFVALGHALQKRGHQVCIATAQEYLPLAAQHGLATACVGGSIREQMDFELVYQALDAATQPLPLGFALSFLKQVGPLVQRIVADSYAASVGADGLIVSTLGRYPGAAVAEKLGLKLLPVHLHPFGPTTTHPDLSFPDWPSGWPGRGPYRRLTHFLAAQGLWQLLRPALNHARRRVLGLPPVGLWATVRHSQQTPPLTLYAYSPQLAPPPADWPPERQVTGYWLLPPQPDWQPPAELRNFLASGPPPVYVGFGSLLVGRNPAGMTHLVLAALAQTQHRALLFAGWGDFATGALPPTCLRIEAVPHQWLFPQVAAVVTHGGAGTVAAALHAGVPIVGLPSFGDQHFWCQQAYALGAGTMPLPRNTLTAAHLAHAIHHATHDAALRQQAQQLQRQMLLENGTHQGVAAVERFFDAA